MATFDFNSNLRQVQSLVVDRAVASPLPDWQYLDGVTGDYFALRIERIDGGGALRNVIGYCQVGIKTAPDYWPLVLARPAVQIAAQNVWLFSRADYNLQDIPPSDASPLALVPQVWLAPQFSKALLTFWMQ